MNSSQLGTATFVIGALSISFAACATSSDSTGSAGASSTTAGSGVGGGSAGDIGVAGSGVAGSLVSAGSPGFAGSTGFGGSPGAAGAATGTAGAGTGTAGAATGTAGAGAMSCGTLMPVTGDPTCCVAAGTAADLAIDDLEDKDNVILPLGQRQGYWYTYGTDATQKPLPASLGGTTFVPQAGGHPCSLMPVPPACAGTTGGALWAALTSGSVMPSVAMTATTAAVDNQAGIGVGFNNHFNKSCPYNASAYKGISFWAKVTVPQGFRAVITTPSTVPASAGVAGTCATGCYDSYSMSIAPVLDGTWQNFTILFNDPMFKQVGWGTVVPAFESSKILDLQFQVDGAATGALAYGFGIDDVAFIAQ